MPFKANVFQIQEWYLRSNTIDEQKLLDHVLVSIRILGCDEIWVHFDNERELNMGNAWIAGGEFVSRRFVKR